MGFRNPITTADSLTGGTLAGTYSLAGLLTLGVLGGGRTELDGRTATRGLRFYAADGVTVLLNLDGVAGGATFKGNVAVGSTVPASTVAGKVASAAAADTATSATSASTVPAAGVQSGTIAGLLTVGNVAASHAEIGTNAGGKSGIRLYAADGTTILIDQDTGAGAGTITGALIRTAASGKRLELAGGPTTFNRLSGYTGDAAETGPAQVLVDLIGGGIGFPQFDKPDFSITSPELNSTGVAQLSLVGGARGGTIGPAATLTADTITLAPYTGGGTFAVITSSGMQLAKAILAITSWTAATSWAGGWSVGSPAPFWTVDAAGEVKWRGRVNAPVTLVEGVNITPTGNPPPWPTTNIGRIPIAFDTGVGELFVGVSGMQLFKIPAGATWVDLGNARWPKW